MGTGPALREYNPEVRLIAMQPDGPFHGLEGSEAHGLRDRAADLRRRPFPDENVTVATEAAYAMVKRLAREEGCWSASPPLATSSPRSKSRGSLDSGTSSPFSATARTSTCRSVSGRDED